MAERLNDLNEAKSCSFTADFARNASYYQCAISALDAWGKVECFSCCWCLIFADELQANLWTCLSFGIVSSTHTDAQTPQSCMPCATCCFLFLVLESCVAQIEHAPLDSGVHQACHWWVWWGDFGWAHVCDSMVELFMPFLIARSIQVCQESVFQAILSNRSWDSKAAAKLRQIFCPIQSSVHQIVREQSSLQHFSEGKEDHHHWSR